MNTITISRKRVGPWYRREWYYTAADDTGVWLGDCTRLGPILELFTNPVWNDRVVLGWL